MAVDKNSPTARPNQTAEAQATRPRGDADKPKRVQKPIDKKLYIFYRGSQNEQGQPDVEIIDVVSDKRKALDSFMGYRADSSVKMKEYKLPKRSDTADLVDSTSTSGDDTASAE